MYVNNSVHLYNDRYSSVEMLGLSRKRRSMGDRGPAEIPQRVEHDIDEHQQGTAN